MAFFSACRLSVGLAGVARFPARVQRRNPLWNLVDGSTHIHGASGAVSAKQLAPIKPDLKHAQVQATVQENDAPPLSRLVSPDRAAPHGAPDSASDNAVADAPVTRPVLPFGLACIFAAIQPAVPSAITDREAFNYSEPSHSCSSAVGRVACADH